MVIPCAPMFGRLGDLRGPRGLGWVLLGSCWLAAAAMLLYRVRLGVSNRDEAFYNAMAYSFLLGNRPYVDELAVHQNAAILMTPLFRAYLAVHGSPSGIVLYNRYLYLVYLGVCAVSAYGFVTRRWGRLLGGAVSLLVLVFSYYNLQALSYNTVSAFGFFCGVLLSASAVELPRPGVRLFGACAVFLSALFAYPGLTPAVAGHLLVLGVWLYRTRSRESFRHALFGLAAGALLAMVVVVPLAAHLGYSGFERLLAFSRSMGYAKLPFLHASYWREHSDWSYPIAGFALVFGALPFGVTRLPGRAAWCGLLGALALVPLYRYTTSLETPTSASLCLLGMPLLAPVSVALNRGWAYGRTLLALIWLPGVLAMLCCMAASANRLGAASLGALPVELAGVVAFAALCRSRRDAGARAAVFTLYSVVSVLVLLQVHSLFAYVYSDEGLPFTSYTTRIRRGPMRGLMATAETATLLESVDRDLKKAERRGRTLAVFDDFATGYLSTRLAPRTFTHWIVWVMNPRYSRAIMQQTYGRSEQLPDIVLKIRYRGARDYWPRFERDQYRVFIDRPEYGYVILEKKGPSAG